MSYRVTVRRGPKVERERRDSLDEALELLETEARVAAFAPDHTPIEAIGRRFEPADLVAVRAELRGPGLRAGVDVRGDGSVVAWTGRMSRTAIEPQGGESPYAALRRALTA